MRSWFRPKYILIAILAAAFALRLWGIGNTDMLGDEAADAFRSVGYIDYLGTSAQTQPIDWYKDSPTLPAWTALSFHDDPPLGFMVQHAFFTFFGDSSTTARLPGIFLGTLAVWLLYEITKIILDAGGVNDLLNSRLRVNGQGSMVKSSPEVIALLAAGLYAIEPATVGIFRSALLEPILLFFILLNVWCFLKFVEDRRWWWLFGLTLGAVALTKYTGVFLVPLYALYLFLSDRNLFRNWRLYAALLLTVVLFLPVIVYNVQMLQARGHFDLQFAYLLHQATPEWTGLIGKTQAPFSAIIPNLITSYGIPFLAVVFAGLVIAGIWYWKYRRQGMLFVLGYVLFLGLLLVKIGSASRFLAMLGPAFAILAAIALWSLAALPRASRIGRYALIFAVALFMAYEAGVAIDRNILSYPSYGVAGLDNYFSQQFNGIESAVIPEADNVHLTAITKEFAAKKSPTAPRKLVMIVYNDQIALPTLEWVFYRRFFYHSIPTMYVQNFESALKVDPTQFNGFTVYFVQTTPHTLLDPFRANDTAGDSFEQQVIANGVQPDTVITGTGGQEMFRVYKFTL